MPEIDTISIKNAWFDFAENVPVLNRIKHALWDNDKNTLRWEVLQKNRLYIQDEMWSETVSNFYNVRFPTKKFATFLDELDQKNQAHYWFDSIEHTDPVLFNIAKHMSDVFLKKHSDRFNYAIRELKKETIVDLTATLEKLLPNANAQAQTQVWQCLCHINDLSWSHIAPFIPEHPSLQYKEIILDAMPKVLSNIRTNMNKFAIDVLRGSPSRIPSWMVEHCKNHISEKELLRHLAQKYMIMLKDDFKQADKSYETLEGTLLHAYKDTVSEWFQKCLASSKDLYNQLSTQEIWIHFPDAIDTLLNYYTKDTQLKIPEMLGYAALHQGKNTLFDSIIANRQYDRIQTLAWLTLYNKRKDTSDCTSMRDCIVATMNDNRFYQTLDQLILRLRKNELDIDKDFYPGILTSANEVESFAQQGIHDFTTMDILALLKRVIPNADQEIFNCLIQIDEIHQSITQNRSPDRWPLVINALLKRPSACLSLDMEST